VPEAEDVELGYQDDLAADVDDGAADSDPEGLDSEDEGLNNLEIDEASDGMSNFLASVPVRKLITFLSAVACPTPILSSSQRPADESLYTPSSQCPSCHHLDQRSRDIPHHSWNSIRCGLRASQRKTIRPFEWSPIIPGLLDIESLRFSTSRSSGTYRPWTLLSTLLISII